MRKLVVMTCQEFSRPQISPKAESRRLGENFQEPKLCSFLAIATPDLPFEPSSVESTTCEQKTDVTDYLELWKVHRNTRSTSPPPSLQLRPCSALRIVSRPGMGPKGRKEPAVRILALLLTAAILGRTHCQCSGKME